MKKERAVMDTLMNKLKENKKLFVIILIISLIAILLGSYAIYKNNSKTEKVSKIEKSEKLEKKAEKKLKEAKKSGGKEEIAKAEKELKEVEEKTEEVKNTASSSTANTSKSSSSTASKPSPKPKEKKQVWVVDKPAWTETVQEPIYSTRTYWVVQTQDGSKTKCYSEYEAQVLCAETDYSSYYEDTEQYISGYNTKTINHPEQGHPEYR